MMSGDFPTAGGGDVYPGQHCSDIPNDGICSASGGDQTCFGVESSSDDEDVWFRLRSPIISLLP